MNKIYFLVILYVLSTLIRMPVASTVSKPLTMSHTTGMILDYLDLSTCLDYLLLNQFFYHNLRSILTLTIYQRYADFLNNFNLHISWDLLRRYEMFRLNPLDPKVSFPEPTHRMFWPEPVHQMMEIKLNILEKPNITDTEIIQVFQRWGRCHYDREQNAKGKVTVSLNDCILPISYNISSTLLYLYPRSEYESSLSVLVRIPMVLVFEKRNLDRKILSITEWAPTKWEYFPNSTSNITSIVNWHSCEKNEHDEYDISKNWKMQMFIFKNKIIGEIYITFLDDDGFEDECGFITSDQGNSYQAYASTFHEKYKDSFYKQIKAIYYPDTHTSETKKNEYCLIL